MYIHGTLNIAKTMLKLKIIEAEGDKIRTEMRGVKEEISGCKESVQKMLSLINLTQWHK